MGQTHHKRGWLGVELISSEKRPWGKVGAETEGKIKSGVEAGELELPASGCYYTSIMRNGRGGGLVFAPWHTLD